MNKNKLAFERFYQRASKDGKEGIPASFTRKIAKIDILKIFTSFEDSEFLYYWNKPSEEFEFLAIKKIEKHISIEGSFGLGKSGFISNAEDYNLNELPLIIGAKKFSSEEKSSGLWEDFAVSEWYIPKFVIIKNQSDCYVIFNFILNEKDYDHFYSELEVFLDSIEEESKPKESPIIEEMNATSKNVWTQNIESALDEIRSDNFKKVVLSRFSEYSINSDLNFSFLLDQLISKYPDCYIFAYKKNDSMFFGASPEKLLKFSDQNLEIDALAGSISRGKSEEEDSAMGERLLNSKKDRNEQKAVTEYILNILKKYSTNIKFDEEPRLKKFRNIQHLWTRISAEINEDDLSEIINDLHPTPAVCGSPKNEALKFITENEDYSRGLYAGFTGWIGNNQAEFCVSIRSALLKKNKLYLFAGCGIVEGSEPEAEYEETKLKLKPILSLFENEKTGKQKLFME